jgi:glycosyltransferase involved in cell wall biosynthesis
MNSIDSRGAQPDLPHGSSSTIVVDGVFFKINNTGIARTWREILSRWQHSAWARRVVVIDRDGSLPSFEGLRTIRCPMFAKPDWQPDRKTVQAVCDDVGASLFISSYYTRPERTPSVMMVYDMIPELAEGYDLSLPPWRQKHDAIAHAIGYACNTHNTLADLHKLFPASATKPASIISRGVSAVFTPPGAEEIRSFRERVVVPHLAGRRYILFVGMFSNYKNAALLLEAFAAMEERSRQRYAVLFTTSGPMVAQFQNLPGLIAHVAELPDAELRLAYAAAECLVYPSLHEGFGLPPIEAMACGCPVVCSGVSSMPEVVGDAALIIDPRQPRELTAALRELRNSSVADEFRRRGLERARVFSWDRTAERLATFLSQCADGLGAAHGTLPSVSDKE